MGKEQKYKGWVLTESNDQTGNLHLRTDRERLQYSSWRLNTEHWTLNTGTRVQHRDQSKWVHFNTSFLQSVAGGEIDRQLTFLSNEEPYRLQWYINTHVTANNNKIGTFFQFTVYRLSGIPIHRQNRYALCSQPAPVAVFFSSFC
jgi:hypothetical protein